MAKEELKKIVIVDDNNANLTACRSILKPHYMVYPATSASKMFGLMEQVIPDLVLMDVDMPEMNGYEAAGRMKKNEALKHIPIIFLSGRIDPASEIFGLNMGALDYIHKPFVGELLLRRIKTHLSLIEYQKNLEDKNRSDIRSDIGKSIIEIGSPLNDIISSLEKALAENDGDNIKRGSRMLLDQISTLINTSRA